MAGVIVVGMQWGDEGKGKIVDVLARNMHAVARYNGGHNAGHTVVIDGRKTVIHQVPSGVFYPHTINVIGNGCVIDPDALKKDVDELRAIGIDLQSRLYISERAHVIRPEHIKYEKESGLQERLGTTGKGIGPAYVSKYERTGVRVCDVPELFSFLGTGAITDVSALLDELLEEDKTVGFESATGTMLDIDHGTYPFVHASSAAAGGALTGTGVGPTRIDRVIGVAKAYTTRVGLGPFPTELGDEERIKTEGRVLSAEDFVLAYQEGDEYAQGKVMRIKGDEYGSTTGRSRRCGWLDLVVLRHAKRVNGLTEIALAKLDMLSGFQMVKVCVGYQNGGRITESFPASGAENYRPVYAEFRGWEQDISGAKDYDDLPRRAHRILEFIERETGVPITIISVGSERTQTIVKN